MQEQRVVWLQSPQATQAACTLCGNTQGNQLLLQARHWQEDKGWLNVGQCAACGSAWFLEAAQRNTAYPDTATVLADPNFIVLIYHYLEMVNGLDWKVYLLERLPFQQFNSVLEIGCNAAVALDYCHTCWPAEEVMGLEPSAYGVLGSELLSIPVIPHYMHEASAIQGKQFDCIFATEVLEHVEEPLAFLQEAASYLAPQGVLLLTTPRAGALHATTPPGELYAALSPGSHYFLLSPEKLQDLAQQAGFRHCHIEAFGMTNVAVLARQAVELQPIGHVQARLFSYYQAKIALQYTDERVYLGNLLHYLVLATELGQPVEQQHWQAATQLLQSLFAIDLEQPRQWLNGVLQTNSLTEFGRYLPYNLPFYCYALAQQQQLQGRAVSHYLLSARLIILQGLKIDFQNCFVYHPLLNKLEKVPLIESETRLHTDLWSQAEQLQQQIPELKPEAVPLPQKLQHYWQALVNKISCITPLMK